jgi:hypothetical protein
VRLIPTPSKPIAEIGRTDWSSSGDASDEAPAYELDKPFRAERAEFDEAIMGATSLQLEVAHQV